MEIAWFTDTWLPTRDGVVNSLLSFKKILEKEHEIYIFAPGKKDGIEDNIIYFKARAFSKYPNYRIASPIKLFSKKVAKMVDEYGIEIIHSHSPGVIGTHAVIASHLNSIPLVFTFHTFLQDSVYFFSEGMQDFARKLLEIWLRWYFRRCDAVIAPSRYVAKKLEEYHEWVEVIPTGIDINRFKNGDGERIKERYGDKIVLYVGRIVKEKNIDLILKVAKMVDATFIIGGEGPYLNELKKKAEGIENVVFTGFIRDEELPDFYKAADVFAFPSTYETQGIVVLEAMAAGTPVVAANARATPEFIEEGKNGYLFEPANANDFAEKIVMAMEDDEMGRNAMEFVKKYSIENMAQKLVNFYDRVRSKS